MPTLTEQGRRLMLETYDGKSETIDMLVQHLGVSRSKVRTWACQLGLSRQRWTREEITYLERHITTKSIAEIARHLKRTPQAISHKAKRIGARKMDEGEGYTLNGVMAGLGCNNNRIQRWIRNGWLTGKRRQTGHVRDAWYFDVKDIRAFIINHPGEIDQRRMDWIWVVDILAGGRHGIGELG